MEAEEGAAQQPAGPQPGPQQAQQSNADGERTGVAQFRSPSESEEGQESTEDMSDEEAHALLGRVVQEVQAAAPDTVRKVTWPHTRVVCLARLACSSKRNGALRKLASLRVSYVGAAGASGWHTFQLNFL